jgi:hypothetical protein
MTVWAMWHMGNKTLWGPIGGMLSEVVWFAVIFYSGLWGILPLNLFLTYVNYRNFKKWRHA